MAENTKIEWADHTLNLWHGCQKVHAGCDHCYAETLNKRWGHNNWGPHTSRRIIISAFSDLARFQKLAQGANTLHTVFVGSMMDIFEKPMPLTYADGKPCRTLEGDFVSTQKLRNDLFANISDGLYPNLIFLFLTKRPSNILKYIPGSWKSDPPENVMYGTSVVDQKTTDDLIPYLLEVPGRHFLSCEPLLGPIDLTAYLWTPGWVPSYNDPDNLGCHPLVELSGDIDWVIVGGESGHGARPMHPDWARGLRERCAAAGVPFFFKQWGEWRIYDHYAGDNAKSLGQFYGDEFMYGNYIHRHGMNDICMAKAGKKAAGRTLDGQIHNEFPEFFKKEVPNG